MGHVRMMLGSSQNVLQGLKLNSLKLSSASKKPQMQKLSSLKPLGALGQKNQPAKQPLLPKLPLIRNASVQNHAETAPESTARDRMIVETTARQEYMQVDLLEDFRLAPTSFAHALIQQRPKRQSLGGNLEDIDNFVSILVSRNTKNKEFKFDSLSHQDKVENARSKANTASVPSLKVEPPSASSSISKKKKLDVQKEYTEMMKSEKPTINLVVVGHVDSGKSTLMGHLLCLLGEVEERVLEKYSRDAARIGKASFSFAWVLDSTEEERNRGITVNVAMNQFQTNSKKFVLLDAPGHKDFVSHMITGASQADAALLVVDASKGGFEAGFIAEGQTKEHILLVRSLGVKELIVAVNKMDTVEWNRDRYKDIVDQLKPFLLQAGFKESLVKFLPCSGFVGTNLVSNEEKELAWYQGSSLVNLLDNLSPPERSINKPCRLMVHDFYKNGLAGRIEQGSIQIGEELFVMPTKEKLVVKSIIVQTVSRQFAVAGEQVEISVSIDTTQVFVGNVLCSQDSLCPVMKRFNAQIVVMDPQVPLIQGSRLLLHYHAISQPVIITKLSCIIDKATGEVLKEKPRVIGKSQVAKVEIMVDESKAICLETFKDCKELGRFLLRRQGKTVAAGIILDQIE